jgi:ligand-binding sensor domain-containing protein/two-component sensor histidine kinase
MKNILKILVPLILISDLFAATDEYIIKQLTDSDGLSQSTIYQTIQDKRGYLWFGTIDGLNRYDGYEFRVYSNDPSDSSSISDNFISSLFEDEDGYIWVGTVNGFFNRFDRKTEKFRRYYINDFFEMIEQPNPAYYDYPLAFSRNQINTITAITEDDEGWLWISTWGNGVIRFDKEKETAIHFYNQSEENISISYNRITDILIDNQGEIWIATFGNGIDRISYIASPEKNSINSIRYSFNNYSSNENSPFSLNDKYIITLFEDKDENLWIGTYNGGLNLLDAENRRLPVKKARFQHYTANKNCEHCLCNNTVMAIEQDFEDYLWVGTFGGGIDRFNSESQTFTHFNSSPGNPNALPDNEILSLFVDRSGILWVGSHLGEGVTKLQKNYAKFELLNKKTMGPLKLNDDVVWSVFRDSNRNLWVGTYRGGVNVLNFENREVKTYKHNPDDPKSLSDNHIRSFAEDNFGNIWIGTYSGGLNRYNPATNKFDVFKNIPDNPNSLAANQVLDILIESDRVIWAATFGGGLNKLSFKESSSEEYPVFTHYKNDVSDSTSIPDDRVYVLNKASKNNFWVGTYGGGISKFNQASGKFQNFINHYYAVPSLKIDKILSILEDSRGTIWIGTSGSGLCRLNENDEKIFCYSKNEGLTSAVIYGLLEDSSGNLWMSTDDGIFMFNQSTETFTQFGIEDGLQSHEFSGGAYFKDEDGLMYFGGINGLNYFSPDDIVMRSYMPPIEITAVNIFNNRLSGEFDELILSYDQNFISFEFAALDYSNPARNKYSYILEGFEDEWQNTDFTRRAAYYTNLPAGEYRFRVIGSNPDGVWNETGAVLSLIINPPFWQTWWFLTLIVILIGFLIYYASTIRIKNQLAIEKIKTKIASDLHDNIGAGLTEISILSEVANQKADHAYDKLKYELKTISDTSRELVDSMSDIVWVVNPKRDSLYDLIIKLKDSYNDFLNSVGISFQVKNIDKTNDVRLPMDYKQNLLLMFKEAINNSIKHSKCTKIILEANISNDKIVLTLTDDGIGFDDRNYKHGNGMINMSERAKKIGGKISWESSPESGTRVVFVGKIDKFFKLKSFLNVQ